MSNEQAIIDLIEEVEKREGVAILLNPKWVVLHLKIIEDMNAKGEKLNPEWLRATGEISFTGKPSELTTTFMYCRR